MAKFQFCTKLRGHHNFIFFNFLFFFKKQRYRENIFQMKMAKFQFWPISSVQNLNFEWLRLANLLKFLFWRLSSIHYFNLNQFFGVPKFGSLGFYFNFIYFSEYIIHYSIPVYHFTRPYLPFLQCKIEQMMP